ncbi:GntR family transcriptional regulator [Thioclava sp. FTW29]|uniref:GntR family transcriptional regulator n=1 Tax=Thioclava litoralis TaxID=3076557 RepID=A0ABZ1E570_9RHOB|nr:GntR family transcriptional regulator [Thioclava sp. FTW29]
MSKTSDLNLPDIKAAPGLTVQEYAYLRLRNAIMLGAIAPGTNLTIRGLASYLDLSPTPVREAIRRLSSENALEVLNNRRLSIPHMKAGRFEELIQLRITLETHAAERALPYFSDVIINDLTRMDDEMDQAVLEHRTEDLTQLNHDFHRRLYAANPNSQAIPLIESVWLQLGPFQRQVVREVKQYYSVDRHKEILNALRQRDPMALVVAIENDIRDGIVRSGREKLQKEAQRTQPLLH